MKLHNWLSFNVKGNLRGHSSGFTKSEARKLMFRDINDGLIVMKVEGSMLDIPSKFIEGFYSSFSQENDLEFYLKFITKCN